MWQLSSISDCFGDKKAIKTPKLNTIWLELIARVLNMPIELKGNNNYSKVFKRVNYKLWNNTFWVVVNELRVLDAMNNSGLLMTWKTPNRELRAPDAMNSSGLWLIWTTLCREFKALDGMNNSRLWLTWMTPGCELKALDVMNSSRLLMIWATLVRELRALNAMNNSRLWLT